MAKRGRKSRQGKKGEATPRGKKFAENAATGTMSDYQAARQAGYSHFVARDTKARLWSQQNIQAHYQRIIRKVAPPDRVERILDGLLKAKTSTRRQVTTHAVDANGVPMFDAKGKPKMRVISVSETEVVDLSIQLRTMEMIAEHGGLVPSPVRAPVINSLSLAEVLKREGEEHDRNAELLTPTWIKRRQLRMGLPVYDPGNGHGTAVIDVEEAGAPTPAPSPAPVKEAPTCDACGSVKCAHDRCPACEVCDVCDEIPTPRKANGE